MIETAEVAFSLSMVGLFIYLEFRIIVMVMVGLRNGTRAGRRMNVAGPMTEEDDF